MDIAVWIFALIALGAVVALAVASIRNGRTVRRLGAERDAAIKRAEDSSKFLASASHDLRQPLHAIALFSAALKRRAMPDDAHNLVLRLAAGVDALQNAFDAFINVVRIDGGSVVVRKAPASLRIMLDALAKEFGERSRAKGLRFRYAACDAEAVTDLALLEQCLRQILVDALERAGDHGLLLGCRRTGNGLRIEVHADGPAISAEQAAVLSGVQRAKAQGGANLGFVCARRLGDLLGLTLGSPNGRCVFVSLDDVRFSAPKASAAAR